MTAGRRRPRVEGTCLALALGAAAGCSFGSDPGGGRFACDSLTPCPGGVACVDGYCQASDPADAAGGERDGGGHPDGGPGAGLVWREAAVGTRDNATDLDDVATAGTLSGGEGNLYIAVISTKPSREVVAVAGLGLQWNEVRQQCAGRSTASLAVFWAMGDSSVDSLVTASMAGDPQTGSAVIAVHRYAGADPEDPIGAVSSANSNGADGEAGCLGGDDTSIYSWSSLDTGGAGSIVLGGVHTSNYAHQPGDAYTERSDDQSGASSTSAGVAVQDRRILAPEMNVAVAGGFGEDRPDWAAVAVELRE